MSENKLIIQLYDILNSYSENFKQVRIYVVAFHLPEKQTSVILYEFKC